MKIPGQQRKAISPIVATVLIIAATLIAAAAILGYVFGIFGSASNTASVSVVSAYIPSTIGTNQTAPAIQVKCTTVTAADGTLSWSNTGSASATASTVYLIYNGVTFSGSVSASCGALSAGSTGKLVVTALSSGASNAPVKGNAFNGYIALSNGAQASFTGTFA